MLRSLTQRQTISPYVRFYKVINILETHHALPGLVAGADVAQAAPGGVGGGGATAAQATPGSSVEVAAAQAVPEPFSR